MLRNGAASSERRLILWEPQKGNPRAVAGSRRNLDLIRDGVAGDVGGSTYRLTRATADRILRACWARGDRYVVTRTARHG